MEGVDGSSVFDEQRIVHVQAPEARAVERTKTMEPNWAMLVILMLIFFSHQMLLTGSIHVGPVGVNYGLNGNNLPNPKDVTNFLRRKGISRVRLFEPNPQVLDALRGSKIEVSVGIKNEDLPTLATSPEAALAWLKKYIIPYTKSITFLWISAGNEAIPGPYAEFILPTIKNLYQSLLAVGLNYIRVTTAVASTVLATSYPPSQAVFNDPRMNDIVYFLASHSKPIMVNIYPYFALLNDPTRISLEYALFNSTTLVFKDGDYVYHNLFDAMLDAFIEAVFKAIGSDGIEIIVSESGWPSGGGRPFAGVEFAKIYNNNFKIYAQKGSTTRYGRPFEAFIFALFNENLKEEGIEQNFGSFYPNMEPVYPLW